jgi:hypothetical protein
MGAKRNAYNILVEKPERLMFVLRPEELDIGGKIILEWILWKCGESVWTGCFWIRIGTSVGLL